MLEQNQSLTSLSLANAKLPSSAWPRFFGSLKKNHTLTDLSLRGVLGKPEHIDLLTDYLCTNPALQQLNLGDNNIRPAECISLARVIRCNSNLTSMILDSL